MGRIALLVGLGGFLGSVSRYFVAAWASKLFSSTFPYGTFIVNIAGCLFIGLIYGISLRWEGLSPSWRLFLATGFCGGFTTFSSFAYENVSLLQDRDFFVFGAYLLGSILIGFLAAFLGIMLSRAF